MDLFLFLKLHTSTALSRNSKQCIALTFSPTPTIALAFSSSCPGT
jgi:hypothetical protein